MTVRNSEVELTLAPSSILKENEMGRVYSTHEEKRNAYRILVGYLEGKRPAGGTRIRWEDNIKRYLRE
jgi:hypothetical protein